MAMPVPKPVEGGRGTAARSAEAHDESYGLVAEATRKGFHQCEDVRQVGVFAQYSADCQ
jgi:hypothetical protein